VKDCKLAAAGEVAEDFCKSPDVRGLIDARGINHRLPLVDRRGRLGIAGPFPCTIEAGDAFESRIAPVDVLDPMLDHLAEEGVTGIRPVLLGRWSLPIQRAAGGEEIF